ncbi:hypothetical protein H310_05403 [Aphanomyces invadans]|uniref:Selenoprotein F/M domain-containing protein n=1 Tax=Aphanomyces invadans TaxID=157072 RepID=A0A024UAR4_9STRA|nr:hypothetical protein H310_05403 [Aphanomyces invadans]ETW02962.1 hypothetical protein H310_05403 [Aphanomyces invadans]RHY25533.1 hypothetical protein DYB32_008251 [Aphanomyces invadans]|eukprot:XP_008868346.1 hypothetical protein H310_05403 [Aphanomyces invadans]
MGRAAFKLTVAALLVAVFLAPASPWLHSKDINYDAVEKAWEAGDMDDELKEEEDKMHKVKNIEERKKRPNFVGDVGIPQTMVVSLKETALDEFKEEFPTIPEPTLAISNMWKEMLFNGGIDAEFFEVNETPFKVVVKIKRGWLAEDLVEFLVNQPQVDEVMWDFETYYPPGVDEKQREKEKQDAFKAAQAKLKKKNAKKRKAAATKTEL